MQLAAYCTPHRHVRVSAVDLPNGSNANASPVQKRIVRPYYEPFHDIAPLFQYIYVIFG
jgi:hypothetical protein